MQKPSRKTQAHYQPTSSGEDVEFSNLYISLFTANAFRAISLMVIGLAVVCIAGFLTEKTFLAHRALKCLTLPVMIFLYLNRPNPELQKVYGPLSPIASGWALAGFFFTLIASFKYGGYGLFVALVCSTFSYIRPVPLAKHLYEQRLEGLVLFASAISGPVLVVVHRAIWQPVAMFQLYIMELWMTLFYSRVHILGKGDVTGSGNFRKLAREAGVISSGYDRSSNGFAAVVADDHYLHFTAGNNMMNAYFLFAFVLGILLLKKPQLFDRVSLKKTIVLMSVALTLLIPFALTVLFMITEIGSAKGANPVAAWFADVSGKNALAIWGWLGYLVIEGLLYYGMLTLFDKNAQRSDSQPSNDPYA